MPRKYRSTEGLLRLDPVYHDPVVGRFINNLMYGGKASVAQRIFYGALGIIGKREQEKPPIEIFRAALQNAMPKVEVKSRRVGGATYQIPVPVKEKRRHSLGVKWLIKAARARKGKPMVMRLADELLGASRGEGAAIKKREDVHKMAEANRAFAHLAY